MTNLKGSRQALDEIVWPDRVYDECGPFTNNPEERKQLLRAMEACKPKLDKLNEPIGRIIIYGTGGDLDGNSNFKDLFYARDKDI